MSVRSVRIDDLIRAIKAAKPGEPVRVPCEVVPESDIVEWHLERLDLGTPPDPILSTIKGFVLPRRLPPESDPPHVVEPDR